MTTTQQGVARMVARGQVRGPASNQRGSRKERGQRGTNSIKAGMQHRNPYTNQGDKHTWRHNEGEHAQQFDAQAQSLPSHTTLPPLTRRRVH
jgi:hypothetical protein